MNAVIESQSTVPIATTQATILIVDDDPAVQRLLGERLMGAHYAISAVGDIEGAVLAAKKDEFDVILLDIGLPDGSGIDALRRLKADGVSGAIIMISGRDDAPVVVEAMKLGAQDYLVKPVEAEKVLATVSLAARAGRLERENRRLEKKLRELQSGGELIGCSPALRRLTGVLSRVAETDATVLIEGKPGTGKTLSAHLVHANGRRCHGPLLVLHAEALTEAALELHLQEADKGTLVVEDVERLQAQAQSRLVRYLKDRKPPGQPQASPDVRVVATTSARLPELVARGKFREDLFYRLNVFPVVVPTLHERRDDVALLATHFLKASVENSGNPAKGFTASSMILLETHPWPGNVSQLQNAVFRAHALAGNQPIDRQHLLGPSTGLETETDEQEQPAERTRANGESLREEDVLPFEDEERRMLGNALKATKGNVRRAAQLLKIGRATLYRKIQSYKLSLS